MRNEVALVSMPFAPAHLPSIGISLLQAGLRREGIGCELYYPNLSYAARIGVPLYSWLVHPAELVLAGDWIFSHLVFPGCPSRDEEYRKKILLGRLAGRIDLRTLVGILRAKEEANQFIEDCLKEFDFSRFRIVGFTSTFEQNLASLALARRIKEKYPDVVIMFGGANCEAEMGIELHRQFPFVDYVCSGEGDQIVPELVKRILGGRPVSGLAGIIERRGGQTVVPEEIVNPVTDMDAMPIPSYDDYFRQLRRNQLEGPIEPLVPFETSRGCWWGAKMHCTFCGLNGSTMGYRSKSPQRVLEEILALSQAYGPNLVSVDNILDLKYVESLFPNVISSGLRCTFYFETKVNLKKHQMQVLREAGVTELQPGIETLSTPILKAMKKGCTMLQNLQFLRWAKQYGIRASWNFLFGFPGEDPAEYPRMTQLIPQLHHLQPPDAYGRVRVVRFSPYFTRWQEFGFNRRRADEAYSYVYDLPPESIENLAYNFEFDHEVDRSVGSYTADLIKEIEAWQTTPSKAQLTMQDDGSDLLLLDSRDPDKPNTIRLQQPWSTVYRNCDEIMSVDRIHASLPESRRITSCDLRAGLAAMEQSGLLVREGDSYLALAVLAGNRRDRAESPEPEKTKILPLVSAD